MDCPRCGAPCERDEVDIGIGSMACGPWGCFDCGWVESYPVVEQIEYTEPTPYEDSSDE